MRQRLYADNAATSFPKPPEVWDAMREFAERLGASAGRGAYREAIEAGEILSDTRRRIARLIHAPRPESIIFTHNGSASLNLAIHGLLRDGDHVVATRMEHNSVLRPLHLLLAEDRIRVTWIDADARTGAIDLDAIADAIRSDPRLVIVNHASNVTGTIQPIDDIGRLCRDRGIAFLVDAAQTIGHVPIDVESANIDLLAFPGHKGLMGPAGTGVLYVRPGLESSMRPLLQGGTGSFSDQPQPPETMPDRFEPGTHNAIGIAGLGAALGWIEKRGVDSLAEHDREMSARFLRATANQAGLMLYGPPDSAQRVAVFSVNIDGIEPAELGAILESEFDILTRVGLHCAPFAHRVIGTEGTGGTVRFSFGAFNTVEDVDRCATALAEIAAMDPAESA